MSGFERFLSIRAALYIVAGVALFINWAVKPFSMAALGWLFIGYLFRPYLPADRINSYIAVPVMLSVAKIVNATRGWYERGAAVRRNGKAIGQARQATP